MIVDGGFHVLQDVNDSYLLQQYSKFASCAKLTAALMVFLHRTALRLGLTNKKLPLNHLASV